MGALAALAYYTLVKFLVKWLGRAAEGTVFLS
jgi:hypothetical protein